MSSVYAPGASFGEVELLRSDELSTPRLATCTCIGQPSGGDCEVLVVTEHMFDLLTDTFKGVRSGLGLQVCGMVMRCVSRGGD